MCVCIYVLLSPFLIVPLICMGSMLVASIGRTLCFVLHYSYLLYFVSECFGVLLFGVFCCCCLGGFFVLLFFFCFFFVFVFFWGGVVRLTVYLKQVSMAKKCHNQTIVPNQGQNLNLSLVLCHGLIYKQVW